MSKIEWTDDTWNPIAGCSKVSEGCRHCYAMQFAGRLARMGQAKYEGLTVVQNGKPNWTGKIAFDEVALLKPLNQKKPMRYFVNSMSDLFHQNVTDEMRDQIFAVMALCPQHTFQVLTKRPERMREYVTNCAGRLANVIESMRTDKPRRAVGPLPHLTWGERWFPLPNVWLGVSVEDQKAADERIPLLLQTPAAVRFLSCEPLLGPIDFTKVPGFNRIGLDLSNWWVIVGGESGPGARPMHPDWARSLRDQCAAAGVPFFFKQWGAWARAWGAATHLLSHDGELVEGTHEDPRAWREKTHEAMRRVGKKAAGDLLDGVQHHAMPKGDSIQ